MSSSSSSSSVCAALARAFLVLDVSEDGLSDMSSVCMASGLQLGCFRNLPDLSCSVKSMLRVLVLLLCPSFSWACPQRSTGGCSAAVYRR